MDISRYLQRTVIIVFGLVVAGCASLSKQECLTADWYQIGVEDGSKGKAVDNLARHRKACAKAGVTPDFAQYQRGHEYGLGRYCNYQNGLRVGTRGKTMPDFCPLGTRAQFELGYHDGLQRHAQNQIIDQLVSNVSQLEQALDDLNLRKLELEQHIVNEHSSRQSRANALAEMREIDYAEQDIAQQLALSQAELAHEINVLNDIIARQKTPN